MKKYYDIFKLNVNTISREKLRTSYFKLALKYHPDKNIDYDSTIKFQEINEAYDKLMKHHKYDCETSQTDSIFEESPRSYSNILYSFLSTITETYTFQNMQSTIIFKIIEIIKEKCLKKAEKMLMSITSDNFKKIHNIIHLQEDILNIPEEFLQKLDEIYKNKISNDSLIRIYPNISDLLDCNLYKLNENDVEYLIPLWHHELIYDNNNSELIVQCIPKMDSSTYIDNNNNIHMKVKYNLSEIWKKDEIIIEIGNKNINIPVHSLHMKEKQTICYNNIGIPRIHSKNIYDITQKGSIFIHLLLEY